MDVEPLTDIWRSPERERCVEIALVLESQGIRSQLWMSSGQWVLSVPTAAVTAARLEIEACAAEARFNRAAPVVALSTGNPLPGIVLYALTLLALAIASAELAFGIDWPAAGRVDGARILAGEWWRTVTALTLHADAAHLLGNLFFGAFFGYSVARYIGSGYGWLAIVVCGAAGNFANVLLNGAGHLSLGASTGVFAALGILSSYCWRRGFPAGASRRERFAPVAAGIGLLAFTGTGGENTDLGAHLLGYVAGFAGGLVIARASLPESRLAQRIAGAAAFSLVALAWVAAIA